MCEIQFAKMGLVGSARIYWISMEIACERQHKNPIESWKKMKNKLKEKYLPEFYRNRLLDKLHNRRQGNVCSRLYSQIWWLNPSLWREPCFKYRPSQPRYRLISSFFLLPIWYEEIVRHIVCSKKRPIFEISTDKSLDIGR